MNMKIQYGEFIGILLAQKVRGDTASMLPAIPAFFKKVLLSIFLSLIDQNKLNK
jgi:hypothetical protein